MMTPSSMTSSVQDNSRKHEQELRAAERRLSNAHEKTLELEHKILSGLRQISSVQLGSSAALPGDVVRELNERKAEEAGLRFELEHVETAISDELSKSQSLSRKIDDTHAGVTKALAVDNGYLQLLGGRDAAHAALQAYKPIHDDIQGECTTKLEAFQKAPLFQYLVSAQYGTDAYKGRFLVRYLDHWLAGKINFQQNWNNYQALLAMSEAIKARIDELQITFDDSDTILGNAVVRSRSAAGLDALALQLKDSQASIQSLKTRANNLHQRLGGFALRTDTHFQRAEQMMVNSLQTKSFEELQRLVRTTTSNLDDELAREIARLQTELVNHRASVPTLEVDRDIAARSYNRAKDLERTLRSSDYSSSNYRYRDGLDLDALLLGYMAGQFSSDSVAGEVHKYREEIPVTPSSGGYDFGGSSKTGSVMDSISAVAESVSDFTTTDSF